MCERERARDSFLSNQTACVVLFLFRPAIIAIKSVRIKHVHLSLVSLTQPLIKHTHTHTHTHTTHTNTLFIISRSHCNSSLDAQQTKAHQSQFWWGCAVARVQCVVARVCRCDALANGVDPDMFESVHCAPSMHCSRKECIMQRAVVIVVWWWLITACGVCCDLWDWASGQLISTLLRFVRMKISTNKDVDPGTCRTW